jgi:ankyrin repeat protein
VAAHHGHLNVVKLLLESGADVNLRTSMNQSPLDVASVGGNHEVTRYLADHMGVTNPLDGIDVTRFENRVTTSESSGIVNPTNMPLPGGLTITSLHDASAEGSVEIVRSLLDQGVDVNQRDAYHRTALHMASQKGKLEVAKLLIKYGADVNCRDKEGWTPLHVASRFGYCDIAELLLDHSADVNVTQQDLFTPLHLASWSSNLKVVRLLLKRGANIHVRNIDGRTPYALASRRGDHDIIRLFLDAMEIDG